MPLLPFFALIVIEVLINWFFYKTEKLYAVIVCTAVNCFTIAVIALALEIFDIHPLIFIVPLILIQALGYKIFLATNWSKALLASVAAFAGAFAVVFLLTKFVRF